MNFDHLVQVIAQIHQQTHSAAAKAVNVALTCRNWLIGAYIHEYELQGEDRAEYGERLMERLAGALRRQGVSACERPRLYAYLTFYRVYPQIGEVVPRELFVAGGEPPASPGQEIFLSLTGKSAEGGGEETIVRSATGISRGDRPVAPTSGRMLVERLSYTQSNTPWPASTTGSSCRSINSNCRSPRN